MKKLKAMTWMLLIAVMALGVGICHAQNQSFVLKNESGKVIVDVQFGTFDWRTLNYNWSKNAIDGWLFNGDGKLMLFLDGQTRCSQRIYVRFSDGSWQAINKDLCNTYRVTVFNGYFMSS